MRSALVLAAEEFSPEEQKDVGGEHGECGAGRGGQPGTEAAVARAENLEAENLLAEQRRLEIAEGVEEISDDGCDDGRPLESVPPTRNDAELVLEAELLRQHLGEATVELDKKRSALLAKKADLVAELELVRNEARVEVG